MDEIISSLTNAFTVAFVVTSMFSLGLGMTVADLLQPLRRVRLMLMSLLANFVILPAAAYLIVNLLALEQDLRVGILLASAVAGAPLTITASRVARGDMRFAGALVLLQLMVTVIYLPFALPVLIPGIEVDSGTIALQLIIEILLPFAVGVIVNYRYDEEARVMQPIMTEISNISLALIFVLNLTNITDVLRLLGTGSILAVLLLTALGFVVGYWFGGPEAATRRVLAIGTMQRYYTAALLLAANNFSDRPRVFLLILAALLISIILVMIVAGEFGRRATPETTPEQG